MYLDIASATEKDKMTNILQFMTNCEYCTNVAASQLGRACFRKTTRKIRKVGVKAHKL